MSFYVPGVKEKDGFTSFVGIAFERQTVFSLRCLQPRIDERIVGAM